MTDIDPEKNVTPSDLLTVLRAANASPDLALRIGRLMNGEDLPVAIKDPEAGIMYACVPLAGVQTAKELAAVEQLTDETAPIVAILECVPKADDTLDVTIVGFMFMPMSLAIGLEGQLIQSNAVLNPSEETRRETMLASLMRGIQ